MLSSLGVTERQRALPSSSPLRQQNDLAVGVSPFELLKRIGDPVQRIRGRDIEIDCAGGDQPSYLTEHPCRRGLGAAFCLRADFYGFLERNDGVDPLRRHTEVDRELHVVRPEQVDEGVDAIGCCLP
jgi:hypothetical protein